MVRAIREKVHSPWNSAIVAAVLAACAPASAQEPTGLQAAAAIEKAIVDSIARCEKSVVAVARGRRGEAGLRLTDPDFIPAEYATGVVVDARGLILTNYHVLGDVKTSHYAVWIDHRPYEAQIKAADPWSDLAILEVDATDLVPIPLGNADGLRKGRLVIVLGNPFAVARDGSPSATWGIVSNVSRKAAPVPTDEMPSGKQTLHHFGTLIQTDARLARGTSGGALLNLRGEMIGLTTSLAATGGIDRSSGYAIPVDRMFLRAVEQLKAGREVQYGMLGAAVQQLTRRELQQGMSGARLGDVNRSTPAARAGLRSGDVVTHVMGRPILDADALIVQLSGLPVDATAQLKVERFDTLLRRYRTHEKDVTLSKRRVRSPFEAVVTDRPPDWRGLRAEYATAMPRFAVLARQSIDGQATIDPEGCVGVAQVAPDSPAWNAGLRPGQFVTHVDRTRVADPGQFRKAVADKKGPVPLRLTTAVAGQSTVLVRP